ncbi:MAG: DUF839 domain-containing protein [Geminicoccaceae bacterium]
MTLATRLSLLAGSTALVGTLACPLAATAADPAPLKIKAIAFTETPAPANLLERTQPRTTSSAVVTLADGTQQTFPLTYTILHRSGEHIGGWYSGLIVDKDGKPIRESTANGDGAIAAGPFMSAGADGTSLLQIPGASFEGVKGNPLFLVNHLEYSTEAPNIDPHGKPIDLYGMLPMAMNVTVLDQDPASGTLTPVSLSTVDFSGVKGLWIPCNGSTTPWMTHLGSEEYEPDAHVYAKKPLEPMNLYLGTVGKTTAEGGANPYMYGHIVEVAVKPDGSSSAVKHYSMGRLAFELGDVMGDSRTVYFGDDGDDVIRAMYVADKPGDLSAGTLYAAKWTQESGEDYAKARLGWIRLGHASDDEIKALIDGGITFADIFEMATADDYKADPGKYAGFTPTYVYTGTGSKTGLEYYRLKPGMEKAAAFLETRRYAAVLGATTEFTKLEGVAHSKADKKMWIVDSSIRGGMIDGKNDVRPQDDVRLVGDDKDLTCGAVYESNLTGGQKDTAGNPIDSEWVAVDAQAPIHGQKQAVDPEAGIYDACATDMVANPDNLRYSETMRTLFIGEDSGNHLNNFVWAYNVDTKVPVRIMSAPAGAENTGLNVFDDYGGHAYITANIQHPGAAEDLKRYPDAIKIGLRRMVDERGAVGYLGGLPGVTN